MQRRLRGVLCGLAIFVLSGFIGGTAAQGSSAATGEITGVVHFQGVRPKLDPIDMSRDPYCAKAHQGENVYPQDGEVNRNGTLPNVFVYAEEGPAGHSNTPPPQPVTLDQVGCIYVPHVLGIMVGQKLRVVSSDLTAHNTHILAQHNRAWNQTQTSGAPPFTKTFDHPEIMIPVVCNVHPWMKAYIGVTTNPFYAVTGQDGSFTIKGVPAGNYRLRAWTATFGSDEREVTVHPNQTTNVAFTFKSQ